MVPNVPSRTSPLTQREREVLLALSRGMTSEDAGTYLEMSPNTVRTHRENINRKLRVPSSLAAVAVALRKGWIK